MEALCDAWQKSVQNLRKCSTAEPMLEFTRWLAGALVPPAAATVRADRLQIVGNDLRKTICERLRQTFVAFC